MNIDPAAFEAYRSNPNARTTLPRLVLGTVVIVLFWGLSSFVTIYLGMHLLTMPPLSMLSGESDIAAFMISPAGVVTSLASFCGIWVGAWLAMRWIHREPLSALFGISRRVSRSGFLKGFAAVVLTSLLSEVLLYLIDPDIRRGSIAFVSWLLALVPIALLAFVQTSSEELLFRAYLPRGLANRFRSPLIWGALPTLVFTALHWGASATPAMNAAGLISIGAFAIVLMMLVYATGNLGAAFGVHLGNNLFGFLLISHQKSLGGFALFEARSLEETGWAGFDVLLITGIGIVSSVLTAALLLHPRSPLRVEPDPANGK